MIYLVCYLLIGFCAGIMSGLLGLGGGIIIVPALMACFALQHFPAEHMMQVATATSLAAISVTTLMSAWKHYQRGSIRWQLLYKLIPGMVLGALCGVGLAKYISADILRSMFAFFAFLLALKFLFRSQFVTSAEKDLTSPWLYVFAFGIGVLAGMLGLGGGVLLVPFLLWLGLSMPQASGTSVVCALPTACLGGITAVIVGWKLPDLPPYSLGFVQWQSALLVGSASLLGAPIGVKMVYRLPEPIVKRIFGGLLLVITWRMLPI